MCYSFSISNPSQLELFLISRCTTKYMKKIITIREIVQLIFSIYEFFGNYKIHNYHTYRKIHFLSLISIGI